MAKICIYLLFIQCPLVPYSNKPYSAAMSLGHASINNPTRKISTIKGCDKRYFIRVLVIPNINTSPAAVGCQSERILVMTSITPPLMKPILSSNPVKLEPNALWKAHDIQPPYKQRVILAS